MRSGKTEPAAFEAPGGRSPGQSILAVCRQTNPGSTAAERSAALAGSINSPLDAGVAAGTSTAAQAVDEWSRLQAKPGISVTAPTGRPETTPPS